MVDYKYSVLDRFLKYVQIDTQSDPNSKTFPSTEKQKDLSRILVEELLVLGIKDAHLDDNGYVYATLPSNSDKTDIPNICFCSHVDTSPDCSGAGVKPIVHYNYQGKDIILPEDESVKIKLSEHADLANQIGNDIVTASGKTLLGADNKAGVAEIMDAVQYFTQNPIVKHGNIKILFTPDEEIGQGTANIDLLKLDAKYAYTVDGESLGTIENETFNADGMKVTIQGVSQHPGFAKGKMESAIKIAADVITQITLLPDAPEKTEGMEGFIHPVGISGHVEEAEINLIIRDFTVQGLLNLENKVVFISQEVLKNYPNSTVKFSVNEQYRNMNVILLKHPQLTEIAMEAMQMAGLKPVTQSIRGGTDGSKLSFMGLPCPNIFAGEHAFHSKQEWVSVQDLQKAVETIINIATIWEAKSN